MTRSMTGFGKASREFDGELVSAEVIAVNHRFLDCTVRLPGPWLAMEPVVKETVRQRISRGKITVNVLRKRRVSQSAVSSRQTVVFDPGIAGQYITASKELAEMLGTNEALGLNVLAQLEGVFYQEEPEEDIDKVQAVIVPLVEEALQQLDSMRATEGKALRDELVHRVGLMREALDIIERRLPELNALYEQRLRTRIDELKADVSLTEERIAIEIALMAEKSDVTEEVVRLRTHLVHLLEILEKEAPVGRELNFLAQELLREVNTLGSKVRDGDVINEILQMKSELERIREQVQNIE